MTYDDVIPEGEPVPQFVPSPEQEALMAAYAANFAGKTVGEMFTGSRAPPPGCSARAYFDAVRDEIWNPIHSLTICQLVFNDTRGRTLELNFRANTSRQVAPGSPARIFFHWVMTLFPARTLKLLAEHYAAEEEGAPRPGLTPEERAYLFAALAEHDAPAAEAAMRMLELRAVGVAVEARF